MAQAETPSRQRRLKPVTTPTARAIAFAAAFASVVAPFEVRAQGLPLIRDAEVEQLMREYTAPILKAAGLAQQNIHVVIINDRTFNAFVADAHRIFVNAGAILDSKTPNQLIGVL